MRTYAKAIVGAAVAGLSSLQAALTDSLTASEMIGAAIATLLALGVVWVVPNTPTVSTSVVEPPAGPATTITTTTK